MNVLPCFDGSFYKDVASIPKPINTCTDVNENIYAMRHGFSLLEQLFTKKQVFVYSLCIMKFS